MPSMVLDYGGFMNAKELIELLAWCPEALDIIVIGRGTLAKVSVSIQEDMILPPGWRMVMESKGQQLAGWKRIVYGGA